MVCKFLPESEIELNQAIEYYENCQSGLGEDFKNEVLAGMDNITNYPEAWFKVSAEYHRILLNRFPYGIIYSIEDGFVLIVAIMNLHRKPYYWKNRME